MSYESNLNNSSHLRRGSSYSMGLLSNDLDESGRGLDLSGRSADLSGFLNDLSSRSTDLSGFLNDLSGRSIDFSTRSTRFNSGNLDDRLLGMDNSFRGDLGSDSYRSLADFQQQQQLHQLTMNAMNMSPSTIVTPSVSPETARAVYPRNEQTSRLQQCFVHPNQPQHHHTSQYQQQLSQYQQLSEYQQLSRQQLLARQQQLSRQQLSSQSRQQLLSQQQSQSHFQHQLRAMQQFDTQQPQQVPTFRQASQIMPKNESANASTGKRASLVNESSESSSAKRQKLSPRAMPATTGKRSTKNISFTRQMIYKLIQEEPELLHGLPVEILNKL